MTTEKTFQGAWRVSDVIDGQFETRQYFGYSKREAIAEFKADVAEQQSKYITEQRT